MIRSFTDTRAKRISLLILTIAVLAAVAYVSYSVYQYRQMTKEWYQPLADDDNGQSLPSRPLSSTAGTKPEELYTKAEPLKPLTLLLIGVDSRDGERARSDTMLLVAVHPANQRAYLISIPRDTYAQIPGRGYDKVNHAMAFGGPALLKKSLESFFDHKIDRYMRIDFEGFRKMVDELGGVEVNVKKRMKYTDPTDDTYIDLKPGVQTLNGEQALDYARYRKSDFGHEDSDYERIARQQEIIKALANKGDSLHAFLKAFKLMDILGQHVKTDLTEEEIASLLVTYYDPKKNHFDTDTLKGSDERIWHNGIRGWYFLVPKDERNRIHNRLKQELVLSYE